MCKGAPDNSKAQTAKTQAKMTPKLALCMLEKGNERFLAKKQLKRNLHEQVKITAKCGQFPFAVVLSCIDSRIPTEMIFDQGIGDIFNARVAGNFVNEDILGSMEFACAAAGSKLILVMGHTSCGAIKGAYQVVFPDDEIEDYDTSECEKPKKEEEGESEISPPENLFQMLEQLTPAVKALPRKPGESVKTRMDKAAEINVKMTMNNILIASNTLRDLYNNGSIDIVGAMYDVASGKVKFSRRKKR